MLRQLRAAIAAEEGRPVRVETLARRLGMDALAVAAMLEHARRRGLVVDTAGPTGVADAAGAQSCSSGPCATRAHGCRHCPLASG
jgi:hypothetical protein